MIYPPRLPVALLQAALCLVASAATNHSVDDQDPLFQYFPNDPTVWERITTNLNSTGGNMDKDGGHKLTGTKNAYATITYTFASVYFLACRWPYAVSTNYAIDGNTPLTIDMQDHSVPATNPGGNATKASDVVGQWTSTANQEHTITIAIPAGSQLQLALVDMFIFEVLDPADTSSSISSTSQTSSSTGTTSGRASSSTSSSSSFATQGPSSSSGPQNLSSGPQGSSLTVERILAISMGVVGTILAILLIFLLWRFCIRRKGRNGGNMNQITPQYHAVPTIPENGTHVPLNDNSISMTSDDAILGIQNNNLYGHPIILSYDGGSSSYSGLPSTFNTNQSASSLPRTQQIHHNPLDLQRRISTPSMMSDLPPMYSPNPTPGDSAPVSSSSSNGNINEKSGRSRIRANTAVIKPEVELTSTAIPGRD